jgi:hypothetical protein
MIHRAYWCFGSLDGVIDDVKSDAESTGINSVGFHDLQHRIALRKLKTMVLKGLLRLEMFIDSLRQAMQLLEHKHEPSSPPHSPWWEFWKKSIICLSFPLRPSGAFLNLPKNRQIRERSSPRKYPHTTKLKFCRYPYYQLVRFY